MDRTYGGGTKSPWRWARRALVVVGLAAVAYVLWSSWDREAIAAWKQEASPLTFFVVMAIVPALGVPVTPLFILAGATFGRRLGLLGSGIALAANLAICYWIARSGLRRWLVWVLRRFDYELPDFEQRYKGALRFTLMVKLAPGVPAFVKNYGLGVAGVPFSLYFAASMLITGAYGVALIVLGESLFQHDGNRAVVVGALVVVLALGVWWWRRRRSRQEHS